MPPKPDVAQFTPCATCSALPIVSEVAMSLSFAARLQTMADRIIDTISDHGATPFNGVHLRVEKDARDWATIMGGTHNIWKGYMTTMHALEFNSSTPI